MLAAELALAGVEPVIVERRADQHVDGSRAGGLLSRSLEVLDQRGVVERFLDAGSTVPTHGFSGIPLDVSDLPTRHNYVLALRQSEFEPILADWVLGELGVPIVRSCEVERVVQDRDGVEIGVTGGRSLRAQYLVGCDGGRSLVRTAAGIAFEGSDATRSWIVAEVETGDEPETGFRYDEAGAHGLGRIADDGPVRVVLSERSLRRGEPTLDELREALVCVYGTDFALHTVHWMSRFSDATRQAATYRERRVLVAGDAAHIHPPHGGQGLNTGLQDAVNLGWKLASVVQGRCPDTLLDSYTDERHPVAARVLHNTMAQVALVGGGARHQALRDTVAGLLSADEARRSIVAMLSGLDIRYDLDPSGDAHPLVGRRMPDLDLDDVDDASRVFDLLHDGRFVLVHLGEPDAAPLPVDPLSVDPRCVRRVETTTRGPWELPVVGAVEAPAAVLIRPDGHVAWAGDPGDPRLVDTLVAYGGLVRGEPTTRDRPPHPGTDTSVTDTPREDLR
ncbi:MAG: FAD-dependent monooxygenase [Actinomycetota bacterium]|nr:FAD-dependent monooxygenase [Actinomycetota bacterium]